MRTRELRRRRAALPGPLNARIARFSNTSRLYFSFRHSVVSTFEKQLILPPGKGNFDLNFRHQAKLSLSAISPFDTGFSIFSFGTISPGGTAPGPTENGRKLSGSVTAGTKNLTLATGAEPVVADNWYFLRDTNKKETHAYNGEVRPIGGELVRVKTVSGTAVELYSETTQPYAASTTLKLTELPQDIKVCENISIRNARFQGRYGQRFISWLSTYYCAGVSLQNCKGLVAADAGLYFLYSRDILVQNCSAVSVTAAPFSTSILDLTYIGFAVCFTRTVNIKTFRTSVTRSVYGTSFEGGCAAFTVENLATAASTGGSFDIHGGDSYNGLAKFISSPDTQIQVGNPAYTRGCRNVTVEDSVCAYITAKGNVRDSSFARITAKWLGFVGSKPDPQALSGGPDNVAVSDSTFNIPNLLPDSGHGALWVTGLKIPPDSPGHTDGTYYGIFQNINITGCTFESNQTAYETIYVEPAGTALGPVVVSSQIFLSECTITQASTATLRDAMSLRVLDTALDEFLEVNFSDCTVNVSGTKNVGVGSGPSSAEIVIHNYTNGGSTPNIRKPNPGGGVSRNFQASDFTNSTFDSN